jgi:hypothetical protein
MRFKTFVVLLACVWGLVAALAASADAPGPSDPPTEAESEAQPGVSDRQVQRRIDRYRHLIWYWQRVMGRPVLRTLRRPPAGPEERIATWRRVARYTRRVATRPPHLYAWTCIHRFEAAWNDGRGPYYGGLQMDLGFQRAYGAYLLQNKGTADRWTPLEQMWVAERAYRAGRGFAAWPNTARICGLWS